ncbi:GHMP family kinase ATP-binding protein [Halococcus qingdaonensis]|uniref:GHMP family kinase ATP-binding protein n=1 Tax=Halococcus qingdaonensis TaxID=224402 RepID=UPI002116EB25|nr:GHMP kinase [Halococcus qingdaonensis]
MVPTESSAVTAVAPGSVTPIFVPPRTSQDGSFGVSFAIEDGVEATVEPSDEISISLDGEPTAVEPVENVLDRLSVAAAVSLSASIPVGYGFGASGAATLATALAANEAFDLGRDHEQLLDAAHHAEIDAGTGLGDVFIQDRGGLVWNTGDGIQRSESSAELGYTALDGIATSAVLDDERTVERVREHGQEGLSRVTPGQSLRELLELSWTFVQRTGLATDRVIDEVRRVERDGGVASMAMLGETVIATGTRNVLERTTRITNEGARITEL